MVGRRKKKVRFGVSSSQRYRNPGMRRLNSPQRQEGDQGRVFEDGVQGNWGEMENSRGSSRSGVVCRTLLFFRLGGSGRVFLGVRE